MAVGDLAHDDASRARIPTLAPFLNTYQAYANTVPKIDSLTLSQNASEQSRDFPGSARNFALRERNWHARLARRCVVTPVRPGPRRGVRQRC